MLLTASRVLTLDSDTVGQTTVMERKTQQFENH